MPDALEEDASPVFGIDCSAIARLSFLISSTSRKSFMLILLGFPKNHWVLRQGPNVSFAAHRFREVAQHIVPLDIEQR
jgi:hypothetical protein